MIVRLDPSEGPRFRTVRLRALAQAPEAFGSTHTETAARPPEAWTRQLTDMPTFVAVQQGEDAGVVRAMERGGRASLISLWVAPEGRGRGLGEALIAAVADQARAWGHDVLHLEVMENNAAAITLYERAGFAHAGRADSDSCELAMTLDLSG